MYKISVQRNLKYLEFYRENTGIYRGNTGIYRGNTGIYRGNTGIYRENTGISVGFLKKVYEISTTLRTPRK